jgi:hypothetical protein
MQQLYTGFDKVRLAALDVDMQQVGPGMRSHDLCEGHHG